MLSVLMYLFETSARNAFKLGVDRAKLTQSLIRAGFRRKDVRNALNWLGKLADYRSTPMVSILPVNSEYPTRIYTRKECDRLDVKCRGFLLFLEQIGIIDAQIREIVIERAMALDTSPFDISNFNWLVLLVLTNIPGCENAYRQVEAFAFDLNVTVVH